MRRFLWLGFLVFQAFALERPGVEFKIFQFPPDKIPRIDGKTDDWAMVPESYCHRHGPAQGHRNRTRHQLRHGRIWTSR